MPNTYTELLKTTVGTATSSVTLDLTGISGYTDLRLVINGTSTVTGYAFTLGVNGDTGSNYSQTLLSGNGASAQSARYSDATNTSMYLGGWVNGYDSAAPSTILVDLMNYSNTTTNKSILWRSNSASRNVEVGVILWRNTAAITSVIIYAQSGSNIAVGSTFSLYGISAIGGSSPKATGGEVYSDSSYWYHAFPMSGNFVPNQSITADVLVIAGGGSAGRASGGGGAGGVQYATSQSLTAQNYAVTIGGGGSISAGSGVGVKGSNSTFGSIITANGGGAGTRVNGTTTGTGGSGGGVANANTPGSASAGTGGTFYGNAGAAGGGSSYGGGGGAGQAGQILSGGNGLNTWSSWASATGSGVSGYYAGGGGPVQNGNSGPYPGGSGGGGAGGISTTGSTAGNGTSGTISTGGGGGGGGIGAVTDGEGGLGGSGIVIVRYAK
jgi:hypothetical protein